MPPAPGRVNNACESWHPFPPKFLREMAQKPTDNHPAEAILIAWIQYALVIRRILRLPRYGLEDLGGGNPLRQHEQYCAVACNENVSFPNSVRVEDIIPRALNRKVVLNTKQ